MNFVSDILYHDGALHAEECRVLIETFKRNQHRTAPIEHEFWKGSVIWLDTIIRYEPRAASIMERAADKAASMLQEFYRREAVLVHDGLQLVFWPEGKAMPPHADNCEPDGSPNPTPHRQFAAVIYLNDNYAGGYTFFTRLGLNLPPKKGALLGFRAGLEHQHGVTRVDQGERYTMPMWFA